MMIFVFGSNLAGIHGAGAAKVAHQNHGAEWGVGVGPTGNCYAIPTKDHEIKSRSLSDVSAEIAIFIAYAELLPKTMFQITCVGCGLAGFKDEEIAPLFANAPSNCFFDLKWKPYLPEGKEYWGTF